MKLVQGFQQILEETEYDTIACDIYGVIHDGVKAYPHAKSALTQLKEHNTNVVLLSNSTRLENKLNQHMATKFDIYSTQYKSILSSGTMTELFLQDIVNYKQNKLQKPACHAISQKNGDSKRMEPQEFAEKYLKTGKFFLSGDEDLQEPLYWHLPSLKRQSTWEDIDFVLLGSVRGVFPDTKQIDPFDEKDVQEDYKPLLEGCLKRKVPMICANPDVFAPNGLNPDGSTRLLICPGYISQMYEKMGGEVLYFGKPFESIYDYLVSHCNSKSGKIICVGDNVATDVRGATEAGIDVVMILGGVHWEKLKDAKNEKELKERIKDLCRQNKTKEPTYIMPLFNY